MRCRWHRRSTREKCGGDGPVRAARKALTGGSRRHRGWSVRRLAPWRVHGRRPVAPPATRGCWEVESEARRAAGRLGREGGCCSPASRNGRRPRPRPCRSWHGPDHANVGIDIVLSPQGSKRDVVRVTLRQISRPTRLLNKLFANSEVGPIKTLKTRYWPKREKAIWASKTFLFWLGFFLGV